MDNNPIFLFILFFPISIINFYLCFFIKYWFNLIKELIYYIINYIIIIIIIKNSIIGTNPI